MLEGIVLLFIFAFSIVSLIKLWFDGSLFESIRNKLFDFAYEEVKQANGEIETVKRKGILRTLVRGWLCVFCFTWELSLGLTYIIKFNLFNYFKFYTYNIIEMLITSALLALIAFIVYAFASNISEEEI